MRSAIRQSLYIKPSNEPLNLIIDTSKTGSATNTIILPFVSQATNARIDWGDGKKELINTGQPITHIYAGIGTYKIKLTGLYRIIFNDSVDTLKLIGVNGVINDLTTDCGGMFRQCANIIGSLSALPSKLIYGNQMFSGCLSIMGSLPALPSGLVNGNQMFSGCLRITGSLPALPSGLTDGVGMFVGCNNMTGSISSLPSTLVNGNQMFQNCFRITGNIPAMPSNLITAINMFINCSSLVGNIPAIPNSLINGSGMFNGCVGLIYVASTLSTTNCANWAGSFSECSINQAGVNAMMADLRTTVTAGRIAATSLIFNVDGGTSSAPSGQGLTDKSYLIGLGATITTN